MKTIVLSFFITLLSGSVLGANLVKQARVLRDIRSINKGKAYELLLPPLWSNTRPMTGKATVELWFPMSRPVQLNALRAKNIFELAKMDALVRNSNGKYVKAGSGSKLQFKFKPPVKTNAIRFELSNISNRDHGVLQYRAWKVIGSLDGGKLLFKSDDFSLNCDAKDNTFELPDKIELTATIKDSTKLVKRFRVTAALWKFHGTVVKPEHLVAKFSLKNGETKKLPVEFKHHEQGPYFVTVYLYDAERNILLSAKRIIAGLRDSKLFASGNVKPYASGYDSKLIPFNERMKQNKVLWEADGAHCMSARGVKPGQEFFAKLKDGGADIIMGYMRYSEFEPLPGVYNFDYFDHMVKQAGKYKLGLNLGMWWWDFKGPSQYWLADERIRKADGSYGKGWGGTYSVFSRKFRRHIARAVELFIKRYRNCPEVWMWYPHPYGAVDHDARGIIDYHPDTLNAWSSFLQNKYKTLAVLNKAYKSNYSSWQSVPVPVSTYTKLRKQHKLNKASRVVNFNPHWRDWVDFYHQGILDVRVEMTRRVRELDGSRRGISGMNASGGVGKADEVFAALAKHNAFYGDQGIDNGVYVRRLVAKRQYGLKLRHEDGRPVNVGRNNFNKESIINRANLHAYRTGILGLSHYNYVFTAWTNSPFWEYYYTNPIAKELAREAVGARLVDRKAAYLHSFRSDVLTGQYKYSGISLYRWWLMNGFSKAIEYPGNFWEILSLGGDLKKLDSMKIVIDGGSRLMSQANVDTLVEFVKGGGKLVLLGSSGEKTEPDNGQDFELLRRLGYGDVSGLRERTFDSSTLIFNGNNKVFRKTVTMPVNFYARLTVPKGGKVLGYINEHPGAIIWPYGKGEVVLLGGLPGAIGEGAILEMFEKYKASRKKKYRNVWSLRKNAQRELGALMTMLTIDLTEWAGVKPLFELNADFASCIKKDDKGNLYVYMYNKGPSQIPVFRLPDNNKVKHFQLECQTLENKTVIGTVKASVLDAPGVALPELGHKRFMRLRLIPEHSTD